jgi:hypothetical protein
VVQHLFQSAVVREALKELAYRLFRFHGAR